MTEPSNASRWLWVAIGAVTLMSMGASIVKKIDMDSYSMVVWRLLLASIPYGLWSLMSVGRFTWSDVKSAAPGGLFFGLNILTFYSAAQLTSAANAVVILALQPVLLLFLAGPLFGEWPAKAVFLWTVVAVGGVVISVSSGLAAGTGNLVGDGLAVVSMVAFAAYYLASKKARQQMRTPIYMALMQVVAFGVLLPVVLATQGKPTLPSTSDWFWLLAMVALPGTGHFATNHAHAHLPLPLMGLVGLLGPGVAAAVAWLLVGETLAWVQLVGMGITVVGLAMIVGNDLVRKCLAQFRKRWLISR